MRRLTAYFGLLAVLVIGLSSIGVAQSKAGSNFSGTWALDKAKSELPQMMADRIQSMTWTITQDDSQVTREQKMEGGQGGPGAGAGGGGGRGMGMGNRPLTVKLDGSETTADTPRGKMTVKAKWMGDGKILEITSAMTVEMQGNTFNINTTEHWELADGGKTLKVHQTRETPNGPMESKMVFTKQ